MSPSAASAPEAQPAPVRVLQVDDLKVHFRVHDGVVRAVDGVSFDIRAGETFALVGESGCGKSTIGRAVLRLTDSKSGRIVVEGTDITHLSRRALRPLRRRIQMVFQDPYSSLNPRMKAGDIVGEGLRNFGKGRRERQEQVRDLFSRVGLSADAMEKFPHEFSGGQRQRLGIARALSLSPAVIVADEPVSALDVSVQAQVLNLMQGLQRDIGVAYLFISHDMAVVEHVSHRVAIMYLGQIVELGEKATIFADAQHPYTQALLGAVPLPDPDTPRRTSPIQGEVPSPLDPPVGCPFNTRCPIAAERCRVERPVLHRVDTGQLVACHFR